MFKDKEILEKGRLAGCSQVVGFKMNENHYV